MFEEIIVIGFEFQLYNGLFFAIIALLNICGRGKKDD